MWQQKECRRKEKVEHGGTNHEAKTPRDGIFILLSSPGIDSKESISPAYVA
jgi:hypothetical protein